MSGRDLINDMRDGGKLPSAPRSFGGMDLLLVLVATIAIASAGYLGFTTWLGSGPRPPASQPPVLVATRSPAALQTVAWTEADAAACLSKAQAAASAPLPMEMGFANRAVTVGFAGLATRVACHLSTKTARFCDPAEKANLVAMINDYLNRVDLVELGLGVQGAPMALMGGVMGGEVAMGSAIYDEQRSQTLKFMASYHKAIGLRLQALRRDGIIAPEDFGGPLWAGVPKTVLALFGDVKSQRNVCA